MTNEVASKAAAAATFHDAVCNAVIALYRVFFLNESVLMVGGDQNRSKRRPDIGVSSESMSAHFKKKLNLSL